MCLKGGLDLVAEPENRGRQGHSGYVQKGTNSDPSLPIPFSKKYLLCYDYVVE